MKQLRLILICEELYDKILNTFPSQLQYENNIYEYFHGSEDKNKIYFNEDYIVIKECKLNYVYKLLYGKNLISCPTDWKQIKLHLDKSINGAYTLPDGNQCYNYINKKLKKYYSEEEIESILNSHEEGYDENLKQFHYNYPALEDKIHKFGNCYKYDITKAHASEIIHLFPKASKDILNILHESEKAKKQGNLNDCRRFKNYVNLYVGALCRHNHRLTYNYIVHRVTKKVLDAWKYTGGLLLYANTDSFTVFNSNNILDTSNVQIGDFKLEHHGDIYIYRDSNYWIMQYGNEKVGSCKLYVRDKMDLSKGIVCHYDLTRTYICTDYTGKKHYREEISNICTEKVNVVEH